MSQKKKSREQNLFVAGLRTGKDDLAMLSLAYLIEEALNELGNKKVGSNVNKSGRNDPPNSKE